MYNNLIYQLQIVAHDYQDPRIRIDSIAKQFAGDFLELMAEIKLNSDVIRHIDSINLKEIISMINKFGWLGLADIGHDGCQILFIVIPRAETRKQEKYLTVMKTAVSDRKASQSLLAYLEDRIILRKGQNQVYGSQVLLNVKTNEVDLLPLEAHIIWTYVRRA